MSIEEHPDDNVTWAHDQMEVRESLYNEYGIQHESFEDFCDRMFDTYGERWTSIFTRSKYYKK